jgi:glycosyltransferase involved in cell wall biosynthesis
MKLAIVHERLDVLGGAERVLLAMHDVFPHAPIYTSFTNLDVLPDTFRSMDIRTSPMQKLPGWIKRYNDKLLPFYMLAFQDFDLTEYDVVLSSSYLAAKSVLTSSNTCHICYCHTPMRFAWDLYPEYIRGNSSLIKPGVRLLLQYFRLWDVQTSNNVDYFIANSNQVRRRIHKHYRRDSTVIYPPADTERFCVAEEQEDYYLVVSRLVPYKRIDLAIEACNQLQRPLYVIGAGREKARLEKLAGPTIQFLGWRPDEEVAYHLSRARALIFPGEEDFGILPVEAQASGTPVIAFGRGGALETVEPGRTGVFFYEQTVESLANAVQQLEQQTFDRHYIAQQARQFDIRIFRQRLEAFVTSCYRRFLTECEGRAVTFAPIDSTEAAPPPRR